jgi:hypothetical protein
LPSPFPVSSCPLLLVAGGWSLAKYSEITNIHRYTLTMSKLGTILLTPWFFRRTAMIWAAWLCTVIVFKTFDNLPLIDAPKGTLLATFFGVLATVIAFYHRDRKADQAGIIDPTKDDVC